jgi:hypothetical protein
MDIRGAFLVGAFLLGELRADRFSQVVDLALERMGDGDMSDTPAESAADDGD